MKNKPIFVIPIFAIILILTNCVPVSGTRINLPQYQPTYLSSATPVASTVFPYPTITFIPTMVPVNELHMVELLQSNDCLLPCYLGITPGHTTWNDAKFLLESLGASYSGEYVDDGLQAFAYTLWVGDQSMQSVTRTNGTIVGDLEIAQRLGVTIGDGLVQRVVVDIQTRQFISKYADYWEMYTLDGIFNMLGKPDAVYTYRDSVQRGFGGLSLVYETSGIVIEFSGATDANSLCPQLEGGLLNRHFILTNTEAPLTIYLPDRVSPTDRAVWLPIEEVIGINEIGFYNQIIADPSVCFDITNMNH